MQTFSFLNNVLNNVLIMKFNLEYKPYDNKNLAFAILCRCMTSMAILRRFTREKQMYE